MKVYLENVNKRVFIFVSFLILVSSILVSSKNLSAGENAFCIEDFCYIRENCWKDRLWEVSTNGRILIMLSGSIYETSDTLETSLWLPPADILICRIAIKTKAKIWKAYEIRNLKKDDKKILAYKLK